MKDKIESVLNAKNWTGLSLRELFEAGRLGHDPTEAVKQAVHRLWPAETVGQLRNNMLLVHDVLDELQKKYAS